MNTVRTELGHTVYIHGSPLHEGSLRLLLSWKTSIVVFWHLKVKPSTNIRKPNFKYQFYVTWHFTRKARNMYVSINVST
jgi:hypothetical protein